MQSHKVFLVFLSCLYSLSVFGATSRKVVIIHSYPKGEWYFGIEKGITETLNKFKGNYEVINYLYDYEVLKFKAVAEQERAIDKILKEIAKVKPEYIVVNDDEATSKFIDRFPLDQKIILNGINQFPDEAAWAKGKAMKSYCGVVEQYPIEKSLKMISLMSKNIKQMSVVSSEGDSSKIVAKIFENLRNDKTQKVQLRSIYLHSKWSDWKKAFLEINQKDDLAWILVPYEVHDENGRLMPLQEMAKWIKTNVKVPLLGILSIHTKMGFLSAISVDPYGLGKQTGEIIIRLEKGEKCQTIGFEKSKYHTFEINTDEVARLKMKVPEEFIGVATFVKYPLMNYGR